MATQNDKERLLRILDAHGQEFLSAFDISKTSKHKKKDSNASDSEEEWTGCGSPTDRDTSGASSDSEHDGGVVKNPADFAQEDGGFVAGPSHVTISEPTREPLDAHHSIKDLRKSFMSSKVSNITLSPTRFASQKRVVERESDDERTNYQNDALLHRLVHTKLLSGSLNPDLELNHAQRGKALAGRVLELAGEAELGKGDAVFRQELYNKATKRIRDGLKRKQREREHIALEEAKNLGNFHPSLKRLYDPGASSVSQKRRVKGLGMGIGKFAGGTLKLSREEIASATGSSRRLRATGPPAGRRRAH